MSNSNSLNTHLDPLVQEKLREKTEAEREEAIEAIEEDAETALTTGTPARKAKSKLLSEMFQRYLNTKVGPAGHSRPRLFNIMDKLYTVAMSDSPKNIAAIEILLDRGHGKPKPSDEALDALAKGGVQIVYIAAPEVPLAEEQKALPSAPDFVEAEFEENK